MDNYAYAVSLSELNNPNGGKEAGLSSVEGLARDQNMDDIQAAKPSKEEIMWGLRTRQFLGGDWSVVGIKYVTMRGAYWLRRLIWLVFVLFGFAFMIYQIRDRGIYFGSNPTAIDIVLSFKSNLTFPTVTVCNENLLDRNRSMYQQLLPSGLATLMAKIYPPWPNSTFQPDFAVIKTLDNVLKENNITWAFFYESLSPFQKKRHLLRCMFNEQECGPNNLSLVITNMGYCLQFNGKGFNYQSTRSGLASGLQLVVNTRQQDYMYTKSFASGFRVLIDHQRSVPHVDLYGFRASTGVITSAAVRLRTVTRLPLPYGNPNCSTDPNYSYSQCLNDCIHSHVIQRCNCSYFYYHDYQDPNTSVCNPEEMYKCADLEKAEYPLNDATAQFCGCLPQCTTPKYLYSLSQAVMSDYAVQESAIIEQEKACAKQNLTLVNCHITVVEKETEIRRDWAQIEVYLEDLLHEEVNTKKAYPLLQLLCDVGGAMGLILGSTVLSFFEIIDFVIVLVYDLIKYQIVKTKNKNRITNLK